MNLVEWITVFVCAAMAFTWMVRGYRDRRFEHALTKATVRHLPKPTPSGEHHRVA